MFFLKSYYAQNNLGNAYIYDCPFCHDIRSFQLILSIEKLLIWGIIPLNSVNNQFLVCNECQNKFALTNDELKKIHPLLTLYDSTEEFTDLCKKNKVLSILKEEIFQSKNICDSCQKESPGNMVICWNCGADIENGIIVDSEEIEFVVDPLTGFTSTRKKQ